MLNKRNVHLFLESGDIFIQSPSQYCSNERAPCIAKEELDRLSALGLGVPSSKETDVNNTSKHVGTTSQTEPNTSSSRNFTLTIKENEFGKHKKKKTT